MKPYTGTPQQVVQEWANIIELHRGRPVDLGFEPDRTDWRDQALCTAWEPDDFFPGPNDTERTEAAKAVCALCPVAGDCLSAALARNEHGIWGGTTRAERQELQRERSA